LGYFQALPSSDRSITGVNPIFHGIEYRSAIFEKILLQNIQKISFGEDHVQNQIPALPSNGSKILVVLLGDLSRCRNGEK
jgi:hypothetical protein